MPAPDFKRGLRPHLISNRRAKRLRFYLSVIRMVLRVLTPLPARLQDRSNGHNPESAGAPAQALIQMPGFAKFEIAPCHAGGT